VLGEIRLIAKHHFAQGLTGISSASPLRWVDVGPMLATHANAADFDPSAQHSSISVSGNSITIAVKNSVSVSGTSEGAVYVVGGPAALIPGWVSDGSCWLAVAVDIVTSAPDNKQMWVACGLAADTTTYPGGAWGVRRLTTSDLSVITNATTNTTVTPSAIAGSRTGIVEMARDGSNLGDIVAIGDAAGSRVAASNVIVAGQLRLCVFAGCETSTNDGPHSMVVRIRVAALPLVPP
jgi:hypothetical protein